MLISFFLSVLFSACSLYLIHRFSRMAHLENQIEVMLLKSRLTLRHSFRVIDNFPSYKKGHCQTCGKTHGISDFISLLTIHARCKQISWKSSLLAEIVFFALIYLFWQKYELTSHYFIYSAMIFIFFIITVIDYKYYIIPDELNLLGVLFGLLLGVLADLGILNTLTKTSVVMSQSVHFGIYESIFGMVMSSGVLFSIAYLTSVYLGRDAMGGGDIKLTAFIGSILGYKATLLALAISSLLGSLFGLIVMLKSKIIDKSKGYTMIAFGPYIIVATLLVMYFGESSIISYYEKLSMKWIHGYVAG